MRSTIETSDVLFNIDILFGHIEIVTTQRWEGDKLLLGGYAIHYDRDGKEIRRTPDTVNLVVSNIDAEMRRVIEGTNDAR
jgi:hypothetical protein